METASAFTDADAEAILVRLRGAVAAGASELGPILTAVAETARLLTAAGGSAVALRCDGLVICRARSGEPAPEVGVYLDEDSGISGQALRTGEVLRCDDALTDFRVNPVVCRTLGLRSIAIVPIRRGQETCGILEAFSTKPYAFTEEHVSYLTRLAELAETAQSQEQSRLDLSRRANMEIKPPSQVESAAKAAAAAPALPSLEPALEPAFAQESSTYDAMVTRLRDQLYAGRTLGKLYQPGKRRLPMIIATGVLLAAAVGATWTALNGPRPGTAQSQPATSGEQPAPPTDAAAAPEASVAAPSAAEETVPEAAAPVDERSAPERPIEKASRKSESPRPEREARNVAPDVVKHEADRALNGSPVAADPPHDSGLVSAQVERKPVQASKVEEAKLEPAAIAMAPADGAALGNVLATQTAVPRLGVPVSSGVSSGALEHQVQPVYPRFAMERKLEGAVVLDATIAEDGHVAKVQMISGPALLAQAAMDAVRQWRYRPTLLDGKPVATQTRVTINFKAPR